MIKPGSRYENGYIVPMDDGTVAVFRRFPVNMHLQDVGALVWTDYMRLDRVGARFTGSPKNWWKIMDANFERENPWEFRPGDRIRVPVAQSKRNS